VAKHHWPVFDAADVLNPANLDSIRKVSSQMVTERERTEWMRLKANTLSVLEIVVKRKVLSDLRAKGRREASSRKHEREAKRRKVEEVSEIEEPEEEVAGGDDAQIHEVSTAEFQVEFKKMWTAVQAEFVHYYHWRGYVQRSKSTIHDLEGERYCLDFAVPSPLLYPREEVCSIFPLSVSLDTRLDNIQHPVTEAWSRAWSWIRVM